MRDAADPVVPWLPDQPGRRVMTATYNPAGALPAMRSTRIGSASLQHVANLAQRIHDDLQALATGVDDGTIDAHTAYQALMDTGYDVADLSALTTGLRRDAQEARS